MAYEESYATADDVKLRNIRQAVHQYNGRVGHAESWSEVQYNEESRVVAFKRRSDGARLNFYYTTGTVGSALDHPRQGKTQLFRRDMTIDQVRELLSNPRVHTGAGYHTTGGGSHSATKRREKRDRAQARRSGF